MNERSEIVKYCRKIHLLGYSVGSEGNVSCRDRCGRLWITPSGRHKAFFKKEDVVALDPQGLAPLEILPSSEWRMHATIYKKRMDVRAIIHAHPPYVFAKYLTSSEYRRTGECDLGQTIQILPAGMQSGSQELADAVAEALVSRNAVVMIGHGATTVGADLESAFILLEEIERQAYLEYLLRR